MFVNRLSTDLSLNWMTIVLQTSALSQQWPGIFIWDYPLVARAYTITGDYLLVDNRAYTVNKDYIIVTREIQR